MGARLCDPTKDIDTWNRVPKAVQDAADAVAAMGHGVPLAPAGVAEIPNDAELRFKTVSIGLKKLVVRVPDRYDLALSKTIRGYDNDLQVIKDPRDLGDRQQALPRFVGARRERILREQNRRTRSHARSRRARRPSALMKSAIGKHTPAAQRTSHSVFPDPSWRTSFSFEAG